MRVQSLLEKIRTLKPTRVGKEYFQRHVMSTCITHHLLLLLLLFLPIHSIAQTYRKLTLGSSLTSGVDNTVWASQNGDFAFGFHRIADNSFILAIWYAKIPDQTVVWYATDGTEYNGDIQIPKGSKVELTTDGKLILSDPQGKLIWSAGNNLSGATYAAMLDNGNFVLVGTTSAGYLWESFNHPTDTILPSQILDRVSRSNNKLYSRANDTTFSNGRFRLRIPNDNNFILYPVAFPSLTENKYLPYYNLTLLSGSNPNIKQFVFNESGHIYIVSNNGSIVNLVQWDTLVPATNVYYRATLDFDGVFTQYSHPKNSSAPGKFWSIVRHIPANICTSFIDRLGSGACGYNSYCELTLSGRPSCQCPPEFDLIDPNNRFGGCTPNFVLQGCHEEDRRMSNESFELRTLKNVDWTTSDYEKLESYNEQDCRSSCLSDCLCAVALFRQGTCWKKKLPVSANFPTDYVEGWDLFAHTGSFPREVWETSGKVYMWNTSVFDEGAKIKI